MNRVAIIPARGGSKRLPRKNILPVNDKPMLSYPIKIALESKLFNEVIVSTEDSEIASIAKDYGASVYKRPDELAKDRSTVAEVCLNVIGQLSQANKRPEIFCCLYATAIFIRTKDIKASYKILKRNEDTEFVMGVSSYNLHPVQALIKKNDYLEPMWPEYQKLQSQFYPELVASNGTLCWAKTEAFYETRSFYGDKLKGYLIPRTQIVDVDTQEDIDVVRELALIKGL